MVRISDHLSVEAARLSSAALAASPTETAVDADAEVQWAIEIRRRIFVLDAGAPTTPWTKARKRIVEG